MITVLKTNAIQMVGMYSAFENVDRHVSGGGGGGGHLWLWICRVCGCLGLVVHM